MPRLRRVSPALASACERRRTGPRTRSGRTMGRRLYVGNLPYKATDEELTALFSTVGDVASARVMRDMATGRARGFGFVEMTTDDAAAQAIEKLHQHQMDGRAIVVNEAQPKPAGGGRNFAGGRGFNRGGGGSR